MEPSLVLRSDRDGLTLQGARAGRAVMARAAAARGTASGTRGSSTPRHSACSEASCGSKCSVSSSSPTPLDSACTLSVIMPSSHVGAMLHCDGPSVARGANPRIQHNLGRAQRAPCGTGWARGTTPTSRRWPASWPSSRRSRKPSLPSALPPSPRPCVAEPVPILSVARPGRNTLHSAMHSARRAQAAYCRVPVHPYL